MAMQSSLKIHPDDNVSVALKDLVQGETVDSILLKENIPAGHKFSLNKIDKGSSVIKYGMPIGETIREIEPGRHVHTHNIRSRLFESTELSYAPVEEQETRIPADCPTFMGFRRKNGQVGIRNDIWIVPLVGCVNALARTLAKSVSSISKNEEIQGIALEHPFGCSQLGDDLKRTAVLLAALARHPNAGGVLIVSLGCENNTLESFIPLLGDYDSERIRFLCSQDPGDEFERGRELLYDLINQAKKDRREAVPVSELIVGLKCGGSDAFSGITANPLLGSLSDRLVNLNATTFLTEVPEMFGAESLLACRCADQDVFNRFVEMIDGFKNYFVQNGQPVYENPSPGNKQGGLSTLEEKSLGCTQKGGSARIVDVLEYGERASKRGLNLLSGPGNDLVASTVLAAAGCHLILFTTGRGTPLGTVVPTVKISSNSALAANKANWIDFDAGRILEGIAIQDLTGELFDFILDVASGNKLAKNEINDSHEIAIFKDGVTL